MKPLVPVAPGTRVVLGIAFLRFFTQIGLGGTFAGLVLSHIVVVLPFALRPWLYRLCRFAIAPGATLQGGVRFFHVDRLAIGDGTLVNRGVYRDDGAYFFTTPVFRTDAPAHRWMTEHVFVGAARSLREQALPLAQQTGWVAHEVLHIALRHPQRFLELQTLLGDVDLGLFNTCADAIVNIHGSLGRAADAPRRVLRCSARTR